MVCWSHGGAGLFGGRLCWAHRVRSPSGQALAFLSSTARSQGLSSRSCAASVPGCPGCPHTPNPGRKGAPGTWTPPATWSGACGDTRNGLQKFSVILRTTSPPLLVYSSKSRSKSFASWNPKRPLPGHIRFADTQPRKVWVKNEKGEEESDMIQRPDFLCHSRGKKKILIYCFDK